MGLKHAMMKIPPNMRRGNAKKRCGLCKHYLAAQCAKYGARVRPTELCDAYTPAKKG